MGDAGGAEALEVGVWYHQGHLPRELALARVTDLDSTNHYLAKVGHMPAFNAEFAQPAREPGSAFVPCRNPTALDDVLCEIHERTVGRDNRAHFEGLAPRLPADCPRPHYAKAKVGSPRHADGTLPVWHDGPRRLARYSPWGEPMAEANWSSPRGARPNGAPNPIAARLRDLDCYRRAPFAQGATPDRNPDGTAFERQPLGCKLALRRAPMPCPRPPQPTQMVNLH